MPRASLRRSPLRTLAAALATVAATAACTLIVDGKLDGRSTTPQDAGDGGPDAGPCEEIAFDDGSLADGGAAVTFHAGVGVVAFHSRAWLVVGDLNPSTGAFAFASDGGVIAVISDDSGGRPGFRQLGLLAGATQLHLPAGHGRLGSACFQVLAGTDDALHDSTLFALWTGGCEDPDLLVDAGTVSPRSRALDTGIGWTALDGGAVGLQLGGDGFVCGEGQGLASCSAPAAGLSIGRGPRQLDGLASADGTQLVWAQTNSAAGVTLLGPRFSGALPLSLPADVLVPLSPDISLALALVSGALHLRAFNSAGVLLGAETVLDQHDAAATALTANPIAGASRTIRATWIGGDGRARVLDLDGSDPGNLHATAAAQTLCGGPVRFVAPLNALWIATAAGEGVFLRRVP